MYYPSIFNDNFVDDLFDEMFSFPYTGSQRQAAKEVGRMTTDVREYDDKYELQMELPGYDKEDIKAELDKGYLTISAEHNTNKEEKDNDGKYIRKERYYGRMQRSFYVGDDVKQEDISAEFTNGVLKIHVPKVEAKPEIEEKKYISIEG